MLVSYRVNPLSAWKLRKIMLTKYVNLVNIVAGKEIIPELLQELCNPLAIADCADTLLNEPEWRASQKEEIKAALSTLVPAGKSPSEAAAVTILKLLA
jgi:lipid-A-disaccharide synthase